MNENEYSKVSGSIYVFRWQEAKGTDLVPFGGVMDTPIFLLSQWYLELLSLFR